MADKIIPLTIDPDQFFTCTVPVDSKNISLFFRFRYNTVAEYWVATIADSTGVILIDSMPILESNYPAANLLEQYKHLGIGSAYVVKKGKVNTDRPDDTNLGSDFVLVWSDTDV
jgi:hypothetical protein